MFTTQKLIMAKEDHQHLMEYLQKNKAFAINEKNSRILQMIENAELVNEADFPWEIVRLNSRVIIRDKAVRFNYSYTVVMPELADHKQCKVSVFSEIGSALFGSSRGNDIYWKTPNGNRYFTILAVSQSGAFNRISLGRNGE